MAESFRLAGEGRLSSGETITWTIADGARGRRWREALSLEGRLLRSLLVEVGDDGSIGRLELAGPAGLLTVHPAADAGTLHGNVVSSAGIHHVTLDWSAVHRLVVDRSPALATIALTGLAALAPDDGTRRLPAVRIGEDLRPAGGDLLVARLDDGHWVLELDAANGGGRVPVTGSGGLALDRRGLPVLLASREWPLER